jgi:hypothetical protein
MNPAEIKALAGKWTDGVRSHPDGEVDLGRPRPGWPELPPVGPERVEVVREILTQLGPGYSIRTDHSAVLLVHKK